MQNEQNMKNKGIQIGDFISAAYKCYGVCGVVTKINKSIVVINKTTKSRQWNEDDTYTDIYTTTDEFMNVTKSRISQIGLLSGVGYCKNEILKRGA